VDGTFPLVVRLADTPVAGAKGAAPLAVSSPVGSAVSVRIALRRAQADDLAPGLLLRNGRLARGALSARNADVVDVFRFRVPARGDATVALRGTAVSDLLLLSDSGARIACACDGGRSSTVVQRLATGGYFAVVRGRPGATGTYTISLRLRGPTSVALRVTRPKGAGAALTAVGIVSPRAVGRFVFELEHFDPLSGWHFARATRRTVVAGQARVTIAPREGRWRIRARYTGSLSSSPSLSGWAQIVTPAPS
jgi:hypothetical protein